MRRLVPPLVAALVALGLMCANAFAGNNLGRLSVSIPCCDGAALQGDRVSITNPSTAIIPPGYQALSSVIVGPDTQCSGTACLFTLLQIGVQSNNGVTLQSPACESLALIYWGESNDYFGPSGGVNQCWNLGAASGGATNRFSAQRQSQYLWQLFLNGVAPGGRLLYNRALNNVKSIYAGAEIACVADGDCLPTVASWRAQFVSPGTTYWQRYNNNLDWRTIQQANGTCNGGATCTGGGWTLDTIRFPDSWAVYR